MRAIIYCRVSSDPNNKGRSVEEQEQECRTFCDQQGWSVIEVLVDNDRGASRYSRKDRPAYRKLRRMLPGADVLVTWEASRAQRDLGAYVQLRELCVDQEVLWSYSGRTYDLSRGDDRFTTGLDALLAEKEVDQTRERVLRGVRAGMAAGRPHGKLAYGYRIVRDPMTGESIDRVPDEATASVVREMARRTIEGESMYSIVADFNARKIPGPRPGRDGQPVPWLASVARRMIENPTYAGLRTHRGEVTGPATWQPIISVRDHERIKALFSDPARLTHHGSDPRWLLSGIAKCGVCGSPMRRQKNRGAGTYTCMKGFCTVRRVEQTDEYVTESVLRRLESPDVLEGLGQEDSAVSDAVAKVAALRSRLEGFMDSAADGELTPAALSRIEQKLRPQIAAAERLVRASFHSPVVADLAGSGARDKWSQIGIDERRAAIAALASIRILPVGKGKRFDPESIEITWI